MRITLNTQDSKTYPLAIRTVSLKNESKVIIEFEFLDDLDTSISYEKEYRNKDLAIDSVDVFLKREKEHLVNANIGQIKDFKSEVKNSKLKLFNDVISKKVPLPDNGEGYIYLGDENYLSQVMQNLR